MSNQSRLVRAEDTKEEYLNQVRGIVQRVLGGQYPILDEEEDPRCVTFDIPMPSAETPIKFDAYVVCYPPYQDGSQIDIAITRSDYHSSDAIVYYSDNLAKFSDKLTRTKEEVLQMQIDLADME